MTTETPVADVRVHRCGYRRRARGFFVGRTGTTGGLRIVAESMHRVRVELADFLKRQYRESGTRSPRIMAMLRLDARYIRPAR